MRHWHFYHIVLLWLGISLGVVALSALDVWRAGEFAIDIPGRLALSNLKAIVCAIAPVFPLATRALIVGPLAGLVLTIWWVLVRS
jgi:hypothetical protein